MAIQFKSINQAHRDFIEAQKMFFIASAGVEGLINLSPKGMDSLRIIDENTVVWVNHTGSGNETSAHVQENGRMTIMFNSFDKNPLILKLYGKAKVIHRNDSLWEKMASHFEDFVGMRQFFELDVSLVLTSCGYAVPLYEYKGERDTLTKWSEKKGKEGIENYWKENNILTLDGKETQILERNLKT
jgi:hypothetical protein